MVYYPENDSKFCPSFTVKICSGLILYLEIGYMSWSVLSTDQDCLGMAKKSVVGQFAVKYKSDEKKSVVGHLRR